MRANASSHNTFYRFSVGGLLVRTAAGLLGLVRLTLFAVLAAVEAFVRLVFTLLGVVGFTACIIYKGLLHDSHFPMTAMMMLSAGCCVAAALYGALVQWLARAPRE